MNKIKDVQLTSPSNEEIEDAIVALENVLTRLPMIHPATTIIEKLLNRLKEK